jgi:UDP-GlcNAc:undecaprenyl-phosphate GlcNAc-1-phosphate transferase
VSSLAATLPTVLGLALAAAAIAYALTPAVIRWVRHIGFVDSPGERKVHAEPMPTGGGLAVAAAFFAVLWGGSGLPGAPSTIALQGLTIVGGIALVLGIVDDRYGLPAWLKLAVQAGCAVILHAMGFGVDRLSNPLGGEPIDLAGVGVLLDVAWVLLVTNAVNVIDGLDGLASGIVVIALTSLAAVAYGHSDASVVWVGAILAGSTLGFLRWNFPPARIFLGDTGSQFLGMMMAAVALLENNKGTAAVTLLLPIVAMGVPILDSALAFFRRLGRGGRIFKADREHLHHRLLELGLTQRQVVTLLYYACAYLGLAAYVLSLLPRRAVLLVLILLAMGGVFLLETLKFVGRKRTPDSAGN